MLPLYIQWSGHTGCERIIPTIPPTAYCPALASSAHFVPIFILTSAKQLFILYLAVEPGSVSLIVIPFLFLVNPFATKPATPPTATLNELFANVNVLPAVIEQFVILLLRIFAFL